MEQVQNPAATAERESVVAIKRNLPYARSEVVVQHEHAAADVRKERHQYKQQRSPFGGLLHIDFYDDRNIDDRKEKRADTAKERSYRVEKCLHDSSL